jgi:hypothetical protein
MAVHPAQISCCEGQLLKRILEQDVQCFFEVRCSFVVGVAMQSPIYMATVDFVARIESGGTKWGNSQETRLSSVQRDIPYFDS